MECKIALRLFSHGEKCFGPGVAELLERIDRTGSLRSAAAEMGMAYSKAWTTLKNCEAALDYPLLSRTAGGAKGGCSHLTTQGRSLLTRYRALEQRMAQESAALMSELFS